MTAKHNNFASKKKTVFVVDDHPIVRQGLALLINREADLAVCGEAEEMHAALSAIQAAKPDILILDVSMPKGNGVHVAARISRELPHTRIIGLSMHENQDMAQAMHAAGAAAYLTKGGSSESLLEAVRSVAPFNRARPNA